MTDDESDTDSYSYGEESVEHSSPYPPMPHSQPIMTNKIQLIIDDNRRLKSQVRYAAEDMEVKNKDLSNFYQILKGQVQKVWNSLMTTEEKLRKVQAEKFILQMEATRSMTQNLDLNQENSNGERVAVSDDVKKEYKETVSRLLEQMTAKETEFRRELEALKSRKDEEHQRQIDSMKNSWEERRQYLVGVFNNMKEQHNAKLQQESANYQASLMEAQKKAEKIQGTLKKQVTSLIAENRIFKTDLNASKKRENELECAKYHISQETETLKMDKKKLTDMIHQHQEEILKLKSELQVMTYQRNEKEKSLDELFEVYNKDREELQKYKSQQIDHYYAQYISAEESLKKKNDELNSLKQAKEKREDELLTEISLYKEQAKIFKHDFDMERKARQKLHHDHENAKTMIGQQQYELQRMRNELARTQTAHRPFAP